MELVFVTLLRKGCVSIMISSERKKVIASIERLVAQFRTRNPFLLASYLDMEVIKRELPDGIAGLVAELYESVMIILDPSLPDCEARYIVAHEIYHHLDEHPDLRLLKRTFFGDKYEYRSDLFAAALLIDEMPEEGETDVSFAARLGIPVRLVRLWFFPAA
ncbi:Zn-dependent peptidase ImmA (M78 family) [Desulfofundulus luciae]|uniref:Zn-dependent peptidase ImmA (M78 family) n=1 Tax=Desulfofundulus luciae TaxID=74702 RepID=A0ABU0B511_9FIRM|nr:ImmA/IrrE family metallo-endopeptidase [Desulfofundulus luciae]MDQ0287809.1 Zn-dependent peptidase ImmA (M78 family) [Desulfofundulus luciae]